MLPRVAVRFGQEPRNIMSDALGPFCGWEFVRGEVIPNITLVAPGHSGVVDALVHHAYLIKLGVYIDGVDVVPLIGQRLRGTAFRKLTYQSILEKRSLAIGSVRHGSEL
jgi:hypothetical protein